MANFPFLIATLTLLHAVSPAFTQENPTYLRCSGTTNFTANSQYKSNLDLVLAQLQKVPPSAGKGYFRNVSVGAGEPDAVFGLLQCRGDVGPRDCAACFNRTASESSARCPFMRGYTIRYDHCLLRYSDYNFFGELDLDRYIFYNMYNDSDPVSFQNTVMDLLVETTSAAASRPSLFAVGMKKASDYVSVYALVQCTRDLNASTCDFCLRYLFGRVVPGGKLGGQVYAVSCTMGYEIRPFFDLSFLSPPPSPALPPDSINGGVPAGQVERGSSSKSRLFLALIVALSACVLFLTAVIICLRMRSPKRTVPDNDYFTGEPQQFELRTLRTATGDFNEDNKLGQGGFGPVYKGELPDGRPIAVKRLSRSSAQGISELRNEVLLVAELHHRNLARLIGFCLEEGEKLVVYEYLPNQSLDMFLFDPVKRGVLDWEKRWNIIKGIANGLVYLHEDSRLRIIHRDLKASNILLDENMNPKISDFGLAKLFGMDETHGRTSRIQGTYGYMAPEYVFHGQFSTKSDVFSYGVLILEIVTGRQNSGFRESADTINLLGDVWNHWNRGEALQVVDSSLAGQSPAHEVMRCIHISLLCVQTDSLSRPTMLEVALMLSSFSVSLQAPLKPAFHFTISNPSEGVSGGDVSMSELEPR